MTETFQTFTKRPARYYIYQSLIIITIGLLAAARIMNLNIPQKYAPYFVAFIILMIVLIFTGVLLTVMGKMYCVDGELTLSAETVVINSISVEIANTKRIEIKASDYKGARTSDGSSNKIEVHLADTMYSCKFIIGSKAQKDSLSDIINEWKLNNVDVETIVF